MVTAIDERRQGQSRRAIEGLMGHLGISAGEAEDLLRIHAAGALLPQGATGLLQGPAIASPGASPDCRFLKSECYFPTAVASDEQFAPVWTFSNNGDAGECFLGVVYADEGYLLWYGNLSTGQMAQLITTDPQTGEEKTISIDEFMQSLGQAPITQSGIISLQFIVGWIVEWVNGGVTIQVTDVWDVAVDVQAAGVPSWVVWAAGLGIAGAGVGLVIATRK